VWHGERVCASASPRRGPSPGTAPRVVHASVRSPAMPSTLVVMLPVCHAWVLHPLQVGSACQPLQLALRCDIIYTTRFRNSLAETDQGIHRHPGHGWSRWMQRGARGASRARVGPRIPALGPGPPQAPPWSGPGGAHEAARPSRASRWGRCHPHHAIEPTAARVLGWRCSMRMSPSPLTPTPALQALLHSDIPAVQQAARLALRGGRLPGERSCFQRGQENEAVVH
jgi:hypothetical protein